ncbi:hypothetical protein [Deinococcus pimensis]|uniref:hypothetical protein n=1 Tax=Deinococcus pimensis TaxID=309888 RepID=UPI00146FA460|nr:hypothetical protein [Deinococcus pimensis]
MKKAVFDYLIVRLIIIYLMPLDDSHKSGAYLTTLLSAKVFALLAGAFAVSARRSR